MLRRRLTEEVRARLREVDERLLEYVDDCAVNVSNVFGDEKDRHSMWELLCVAKFLRMFTTYHFNARKVQFYIKLREGIWRREGKRWVYVSGGLRLPSTSGANVYRWLGFQIFVLACVFGFYTWVNTYVEAGTKGELLDSERERDGWVWDFRRMVSEFIFYCPRKNDKTGLSAFIQVVFFLFGDFNSEIYSLAMTENQSKILYDRTKFMLRQLNKSDEGNALYKMSEKQVRWLEKYQATIRNSKIVPLTGGGKAPDGTNTELLNWDELGSSPYINGSSDMLAHINVCQSSMGMRRQPLTFGTTTAGTITSGPFIEMLQGRHDMLLKEFEYETGEAEPSQITDSQMCLLLEPEEYEKPNEEYIITSHALRKKVNPMLGTIVQYDFYDREMAKARQDGPQKFAECISKLFNVYSGARVTRWIKGDAIRALQIDRRITDCKYPDWQLFVGIDFGGKDDLCAVSYLAVNYTNDAAYEDRFFADCDVFITETALQDSPNRQLYELWVKDGWLNVCPGEVFNNDMVISKIMEKHNFGINLCLFAYDPAQSKQPINTLKAWLQTLGMNAEQIKQMVIPCSQGGMNMNGLVGQMESMILDPRPWIRFSANPLWSWCFGNCGVYAGRDGTSSLRRIEKMQQTQKIDPVHGLLDALYAFNVSEGNIQT